MFFPKITLDIFAIRAIIQKLSEQRTKYGGIAQLGERLNGIQEVSGSITLISTKKTVCFIRNARFFRAFSVVFILAQGLFLTLF